jgi:Zn-dependent protease
MLPETASSTDDRPALRSSVRHAPTEQHAIRDDLRHAVASVLLIEREAFNTDDGVTRESLILVGADARLLASFEGRLLLESEEAYDRLDRTLTPMNALPLFREVNGKHVVHVISGRVEPKERPWWPNALLFVVTLFSVLIVGTESAISEIFVTDPVLAQRLANNFFGELWRGLPYALSVLLILGAHELGHYFAARRHKLAVTLPYFLPLPIISPIGTLGAFIQLRQPMRNRKVLLDVGASGPLVGLAFAIPIVIIGLATSQVRPITPGGLLEGNSLLYAGIKTLLFGRFLPDGQVDVYVNQLAWAGWTGLFVTGLNLLPLGQLDGGHILFTLIGDTARKLYFPILGLLLILTVFVSDAWLLLLLLLLVFGRFYAVPLDMITPLDSRRRFLAILSLIVFVVTIVPAPLTLLEGSTGGGELLPGESVLLPVAIGLIALWTTRNRR